MKSHYVVLAIFASSGAACSSRSLLDPTPLVGLEDAGSGSGSAAPHLYAERDWLAAHADLTTNPLTPDEELRLTQGEVLWDRVNGVLGDGGDLPDGFITASGIRILPESTMQQYVAATSALANPTDPLAIAQIRHELGITSTLIPEEVEWDEVVTGEATAPVDDCGSGSDGSGSDGSDGSGSDGSGSGVYTVDAGTDTGSGSGSGIFPADADIATDLGSGATAAAHHTPTGTCGPEACKVTCNLLVTTKGNKEKTVDWSASYIMRDSSGTKDSTDVWNADRQSHMTLAFSCFAKGCDNRAWSANVSPANAGDGTMTATVAAGSKNPDLSSWRYTGCAAEAEAGASATSLVLSHNTSDCNAATRLPSTSQALKVKYVVNSETKFSSGSETTGSFSINYKGNITQATANAANLSATGNGLDGLKVDNVGVNANANNNTSAEVNAGAAAASSYRWAQQTDGSYKQGSDSLSFLNQVQGPPSLNLTNACPQKSVAYKYDIVGLKAKLVLDSVTVVGGGRDAFCSASIKATLPGIPDKIPYACVYSVAGSTDTHDCAGTTQVNP